MSSRRVLARGTLAASLLLGGCSSTAVGDYAEISINESKEWVACDAQGACRFRGQGQNEGPGCATQIHGAVAFFDDQSQPIIDKTSGALLTYEWRLDPDPNGKVRAGNSFNYLTVSRYDLMLLN